MKITSNILKHHLKNVYWVLGTGCAGKSTLCKHLSKKYDMHYYDADTEVYKHIKISDKENQPAMNIDRSDWNRYFSRPPKEYAKWLDESINEQLGFIIADLLALPKNKKIIVDAQYYQQDIESISDYNRMLFLTADFCLVEEQFLKRDDKDDLHALIHSLKNPEQKLANLYETLKLRHTETTEKILSSECAYFVRKRDTKVEDLAAFAIKHFRLE